jgi:hypothetical protein
MVGREDGDVRPFNRRRSVERHGKAVRLAGHESRGQRRGDGEAPRYVASAELQRGDAVVSHDEPPVGGGLALHPRAQLDWNGLTVEQCRAIAPIKTL